MILEAKTLTNASSLLAPFRIVAMIGVFLIAMGAIVSPARLWPALLASGLAMLGVGVAALYFLAIHSVTGAAWGTSFKRVPEAMTILVPVGGLVALVAVAGGAGTLYPALSSGGAQELSVFKQMWYSPGFYFAVRLPMWVCCRLSLGDFGVSLVVRTRIAPSSTPSRYAAFPRCSWWQARSSSCCSASTG